MKIVYIVTEYREYLDGGLATHEWQEETYESALLTVAATQHCLTTTCTISVRANPEFFPSQAQRNATAAYRHSFTT